MQIGKAAALGLLLAATPSCAEPSEDDVAKVPALVAGICETPPGWVVAVGTQVRLNMAETARIEEVDCIMRVLRRPDLGLGFASEAIEPESILAEPMRYVARGKTLKLAKLGDYARASGLVVGAIRKGKDDASELPIDVPAGATYGVAASLEAAVTNGDFGDTRLDPAPPSPAK